MCGIFGYFCKSHVSMQKVLKLLKILEAHQYDDEKRPVGGHGAGVCLANGSEGMVVYKGGKKNSSPVKDLSLIRSMPDVRSRIVLGHVRYASPFLMDTIEYDEETQPYKAECLGFSEVISAHNGKVENYEHIRRNLSKEHSFESEAVKLNDSEVIPHLFEENLMMGFDEVEARKKTFETIQGDNTVVLMTHLERRRLLHILHKGKTRGMHVWKDGKGEIILCSREGPLLQVFGNLLSEKGFEKVLAIGWQVDSEAQRTYAVISQ